MKKKKLQAKIAELEMQVAALETRVHLLEMSNTCRKYRDLGGNSPYKINPSPVVPQKPIDTHRYDWWRDKVTCKSKASYSAREFL